MQKASRLDHVQSSLTLAISARAAALKSQGVDVVSFGSGEPDFNTPQAVIEAAKAALDGGMTKYTAVAGLPELRAEIARWYGEEFGVSVVPEEVIVGVGGKQVLYNAMMSLLSAGDRVLIPAPYWLSYPAQVYLSDGVPVYVETREEDSFLLTPSVLEAAILAHDPKMLILNSPSNPTGQAYDEAQLAALCEVLRRYPEVVILWDNIYAHLTYGDFRHVELGRVAPDLKERIIVAGGLSKTFAMTGWRVGFAIAEVGRIKAMTTIQSHSTSNVTTFAQSGAVAALRMGRSFLEEMRETFTRRRAALLEALSSVEGVSCLAPMGTFYALVNCKKFCNLEKGGHRIQSDVDLAEYLINEAHVSTVPGSAFGAPGYLRLSFAMSESLIVEGIRRIGVGLSALEG